MGREELSWAAAGSARRRERFVGRERELRLLEEALARAESTPQLVAIVGPGGIGKTTLARRLCDDARGAGASVRWLSGDELPANRQDLQEALRAQGSLGFDAIGRGSRADVLVLDAFERLAGLAHWFFERILPTAGARLLVVLTSRERLDARVWGELQMQLDPRELLLGALTLQEAERLLAIRRVPAALHGRICASCHGHALSISLLAERFADGDAPAPDSIYADDVIGRLARDLLRTAPTDEHRRALIALSLASALDRRMLSALVGEASADAIVGWLERSTLASVGARGLTPHALVREAVYDHSLATAPDAHAEIGETIIAELLRRVAETPIERKLQLVLEMLYARRDVVLARGGLALDRLAQIHLRVATPADAEQVAAQLEGFEGAASAARLRHWYALQPENLFVVADQEDQPEGAYFVIELDRTTPSQRACDPVSVVAARVAEAVGPGLFLARWFFARNGYQRFGPELTAVMFAGPLIAELRSPQQLLFLVREPDRWADLAGPFRMLRRPDLDEEIEGALVGVYLRDLRALLARGDGGIGLTADPLAAMGVGPAAAREAPPAAAQRLDEESFASAVRGALPLLHRRHELATSPLARSALLERAAEGAPDARAAALGALLREVCDALRASPAYAASARILEVTFLECADKQRAAAAALGLPYGTYRHQLRAAVALVVKELWSRELAAREARGD